MAEWLGRALQKLVQQFESVWYLPKIKPVRFYILAGFFNFSTMNWQKWLGIAACICIIGSCFMHWAYYPDIHKYFTGFNSQVLYKEKLIHYYGRPGYILIFFAVLSLAFHLIPKIWAKKINLLVAALCTAFAIKNYFTFTSAYTGIIPEKEIGIFLMLTSSIMNLIAVIFFRMRSKNIQ